MKHDHTHCYFCKSLLVTGRGGLIANCPKCYNEHMFQVGHGVPGSYVQFTIDNHLFNYYFKPDRMECVDFNQSPPKAYKIDSHIDVDTDNYQQVFERIKMLVNFS